MLESNTGHGPRFQDVEPLPPQDLSLMRKIVAGDQAALGHFLRHSGHMGELYAVLSRGVTRFEALQGTAKNPRMEQILQDTISQHRSRQKAQENQARNLCERVERQWSVSVALMANHNTGVTIQIAKDARTDSLLMRKMGVVSIIFLQATFLATFFGMMFFQVDGGGRLSTNSNIWVYFASTSAISLMIMLYFRCGSHWKMVRGTIIKSFGKTRESMKEKADDVV
jgi:Mg2+ and Co2+ transporter CorA